MPLTASPQNLPSTPVSYAVPYDRATTFADGQTITAPQFANNVNLTVDLGGLALGPGGAPGSGVGRTNGIWVVNISAMDFAQADE